VGEPVAEPAIAAPAQLAIASPAEVAIASSSGPPLTLAAQESPLTRLADDTGIQIIRATRSWIQYGMVGFAVLCIVIGAVEGLLSR